MTERASITGRMGYRWHGYDWSAFYGLIINKCCGNCRIWWNEKELKSNCNIRTIYNVWRHILINQIKMHILFSMGLIIIATMLKINIYILKLTYIIWICWLILGFFFCWQHCVCVIFLMSFNWHYKMNRTISMYWKGRKLR